MSGKGIYCDAEMRGATLYAKLMGALRGAVPMGFEELADYTGLHQHTVRRYIKALRNHKPRLVRVSQWSEDKRGNLSIACYEFGSAPDVPRPKQTNAQRLENQRNKKRAKRLLQRLAGPIQSKAEDRTDEQTDNPEQRPARDARDPQDGSTSAPPASGTCASTSHWPAFTGCGISA